MTRFLPPCQSPPPRYRQPRQRHCQTSPTVRNPLRSPVQAGASSVVATSLGHDPHTMATSQTHPPHAVILCFVGNPSALSACSFVIHGYAFTPSRGEDFAEGGRPPGEQSILGLCLPATFLLQMERDLGMRCEAPSIHTPLPSSDGLPPSACSVTLVANSVGSAAKPHLATLELVKNALQVQFNAAFPPECSLLLSPSMSTIIATLSERDRHLAASPDVIAQIEEKLLKRQFARKGFSPTPSV